MPDFPGRWLGGLSLLLAPTLILTGVLLRLPYHFFFPDQLAAYAEQPGRMFAAASCFLAGTVLLWPGLLALTHRIGGTRPGWARWGGGLAIFGLFARTFHAGVDQLAAQLVRVQGLDTATEAVASSYSAYHVLRTLSPAIMAGWVVLAFGGWRSGVLGPVRAVALAAMAALPIGVLKGTTVLSVVATAGLVVALVPEGVRVLRHGPRPSGARLVGGLVGGAALVAAMAWLGNQG